MTRALKVLAKKAPGGLRYRAQPSWIPPMLATLVEELPAQGKWVYEPKLDGVRALIYLNGGSVRIYSRNRKPLNDAYPELVDALGPAVRGDAVLDGEIVAFDSERGITSFARLQQRMQLRDPVRARRSQVAVHLYLPIVRKFDYDAARSIAETIGRYALQEWPGEVTLEWSVKRRTGKIFFDYNQNTRGKSLASILCPRRHPLGTVSMPVGWDELERIYPTDFTLRTVPGILEEQGDPWAGILSAKQDLGQLGEQRPAG